MKLASMLHMLLFAQENARSRRNKRGQYRVLLNNLRWVTNAVNNMLENEDQISASLDVRAYKLCLYMNDIFAHQYYYIFCSVSMA